MTDVLHEPQESDTGTALDALASARKTFCLAMPGTDEEIAAWLGGFDWAAEIAAAAITALRAEASDALTACMHMGDMLAARYSCPVEMPCDRVLNFAKAHTDAAKRAERAEAEVARLTEALAAERANGDRLAALMPTAMAYLVKYEPVGFHGERDMREALAAHRALAERGR